MRKIFIIIALLTIAACSLHAQVQSLIGAGAYFSMNTISSDTTGLNKMTHMVPGYGYGISYKHKELANIIGLQAEVNFDYQGFKITPNDDLYYKRMFKYVNVPIYAHVDLGKHALKGIFAVGTYANFIIDKGKANTNITYFDTSSVNRIHFGRYKTFSYGLCGQVGFAICTKIGVFEVLGRANIGMSKIQEFSELGLFNFMASRSFGAGITYMVPFGNGDPYYSKRIKEPKPEKESKKKIRKHGEDAAEEENNVADPETDASSSAIEKGDVADPETDASAPAVDENWEERMNN